MRQLLIISFIMAYNLLLFACGLAMGGEVTFKGPEVDSATASLLEKQIMGTWRPILDENGGVIVKQDRFIRIGNLFAGPEGSKVRYNPVAAQAVQLIVLDEEKDYQSGIILVPVDEGSILYIYDYNGFEPDEYEVFRRALETPEEISESQKYEQVIKQRAKGSWKPTKEGTNIAIGDKTFTQGDTEINVELRAIGKSSFIFEYNGKPLDYVFFLDDTGNKLVIMPITHRRLAKNGVSFTFTKE